jgi:diadenosine tetraphosphatase ApaH/serine/threonine PP2A family protein phosphatase
LIAFFGDIHSNLQALEACLEDAAHQGASRYVFLGDFVGYGGDPVPVLTRISQMCASGAVAVKGNHDDMAGDFDRDMNASAARAAKWTREQLSPEHRVFLDSLPLTYADADRLYVHGDASEPEKWRYVSNCDGARDSFEACSARIIVCGHVHQPAIYSLRADSQLSRFVPEPDCPVPLLKSRRWHVVLPSVGQPRDDNPLSGYALYDEATCEIAFRRIPYDIDAAAGQIIKAGLPSGLASRLYRGR